MQHWEHPVTVFLGCQQYQHTGTRDHIPHKKPLVDNSAEVQCQQLCQAAQRHFAQRSDNTGCVGALETGRGLMIAPSPLSEMGTDLSPLPNMRVFPKSARVSWLLLPTLGFCFGVTRFQIWPRISHICNFLQLIYLILKSDRWELSVAPVSFTSFDWISPRGSQATIFQRG